MKNLSNPILSVFILAFFSLIAFSCKKHKSDPISQLPPETQTGENTFGCLVNGQVFVPKGPSLSPILTCYYPHLNTDYSKGYFFQVYAKSKGKDCELSSISIDTDSLTIQEEQEIALKLITKGGAAGRYTYYPDCSLFINYTTDSLNTGKLLIKKFDSVNQIVSGTFWFNAINENGDILKITDGRFDMEYTR